ncbi:MAG TPA: hypothetical protein VNG89_07445 [Vicinamibacterales bacterium]|jgi:hypothetical protein|nr:hypothetical protein [Vicinamibacterales bacterium]
MRQMLKIVVVLCAVPVIALSARQYKPSTVPVEYSASVQAVGALGAVATAVKVHIDKFTPDKERTMLVNALKTGGYQAFVPALKKAPVVGYIDVKGQKWDLRWAHQELKDLGQIVTVATDKPVYFAGGGAADAKPREGFDLAIIRLDLDTIGMGKGTFAGAARVKPNADATGVDVADYGGNPMSITMVTRVLQ